MKSHESHQYRYPRFIIKKWEYGHTVSLLCRSRPELAFPSSKSGTRPLKPLRFPSADSFSLAEALLFQSFLSFESFHFFSTSPWFPRWSFYWTTCRRSKLGFYLLRGHREEVCSYWYASRNLWPSVELWAPDGSASVLEGSDKVIWQNSWGEFGKLLVNVGHQAIAFIFIDEKPLLQFAVTAFDYLIDFTSYQKCLEPV